MTYNIVVIVWAGPTDTDTAIRLLKSEQVFDLFPYGKDEMGLSRICLFEIHDIMTRNGSLEGRYVVSRLEARGNHAYHEIVGRLETVLVGEELQARYLWPKRTIFFHPNFNELPHHPDTPGSDEAVEEWTFNKA